MPTRNELSLTCLVNLCLLRPQPVWLTLALTGGQRRIKQVSSCCGARMCSYLRVAVVHAHSFAGSSSCLQTGTLICAYSYAHIIFADVCRYLRTPEQLLSLALNIAIAASPQCRSWECNSLNNRSAFSCRKHISWPLLVFSVFLAMYLASLGSSPYFFPTQSNVLL